MPTITPNEAAKRSGKSRRTVMRAITKGELSARRTNDGWEIEITALTDWTGAHAPADAQELPAAHPETVQVSVLQERIRGLEDLVSELRQAGADMRSDRDHWRSLAQRGILSRLFGKAA